MKITDVTRGQWRVILPAYGYHPPANPRAHGPCPMCGGKDRFRFDDREGTGSWLCNQCGHGDGFDLIGRLANLSFREARVKVAAMLNVTLNDGPIGPSQEDRDRKAMQSVWEACRRPSDNSPVGRYLKHRVGCLWSSNSLREHPALWNPATQTRMPAMVCMVATPKGQAANLHCTFLTNDGRKANCEPVKRTMRGPLPEGSAIRLGKAQETMGVAEGIETAMAASIMHGGMPVWAAINGTMLAKWTPPEGAETILVFGDNDENYTGQARAYQLANRLTAQFKKRCRVIIPETTGEDWADVLKTMPNFQNKNDAAL